jgi:preprotein translocase subunit SecA
MEYLRSSVNLRAYGQRDPLVEYKKEGLQLFQAMEETYTLSVVQTLPTVIANAAAPAGQGTISVAAAPSQNFAIEQAARSITQTSPAAERKVYERNDHVKITNGSESREMKYKKAEPLLKQGWRIVPE